MSIYNEDTLPVELQLRVNHFHPGNSSRNKRKGAQYRTVARVINVNGETVAKGEALCSRKDVPSRQLGRKIAVGRAVRNYYDDFVASVEEMLG